MITDEVIKEIYKKFDKPNKNADDLQLDYYIELLKPHHTLRLRDGEITTEELEEFNPFRRFLVRSLHTVLEFDKMVAFVFRNHILFYGKESNDLRVHMKPEKPRSLFSRIFGRD